MSSYYDILGITEVELKNGESVKYEHSEWGVHAPCLVIYQETIKTPILLSEIKNWKTGNYPPGNEK